MTHSYFAAVVSFIAIVLGSAPSSAQNAYIPNSGDNTVSVIDTATNTMVAVLPVGTSPIALGVFIQPRFAGTIGDANGRQRGAPLY
jgi:YVTN family beta-propeller protein